MGEGDIIRHLLFMGYSVTHTQAPLDEYDFMVKNLAVDLRDGVRLCRLVDLHCPDLKLSAVITFKCGSTGINFFFILLQLSLTWLSAHCFRK